MSKENQNKELVLIKDLGRLYPTETSNYKKRYGLYRCYCGKEFKSPFASVKQGDTKSCGCYNIEKIIERNTKHNLSKNKLMPVWNSIIQRCNNDKNIAYKNYGSRGITVYEEWQNNFKSFYDWSISNGYKDGLSIDRINNDGNYEPNNCRWVDRNTQARNTRKLRVTNTSGYRGVHFYKKKGMYQVQITVKRKIIYLGLFESALDGANAYDKYVIDNNLEHTINGVI